MKREFLKELGLSDEAIEKVMAENGKDVQAEQSKTATKQAEVDKLNEQLSEANKQVKVFEDMKIEDIKASVKDFQEKYEKMQAELKETRENALLDKVLATFSVHDIDVVKGLIKKDQLVFKDDSVVGLEEQINKMKEEKAFLFKAEENGGEKKPQFSSQGGEGGEQKPLSLRDAIQNAINPTN